MSDPTARKQQTRQRLLEARQALDDELRASLDQRIRAHLGVAANRGEFEHIAGYVAFRGEPDIGPALETLYQQGHVIYLPVLGEEQGQMRFHLWQPGVEMKPNRYGILEPADTPPVDNEDLDLVLAPLLGFTANGDRLGMGGGYYDRCMTPSADGSRPRLAGVAYALQQVESVHSEPWDVRLDNVVTENGWFRLGQ